MHACAATVSRCCCARARAAFKKFSPEIGKRKKRSSVSRAMTISDRFRGFPFHRSWIMDYKWNFGLVRGSGPIFRAGMARRACETLRVFPRPTSLRLRNDTSFREYSSCRKVFTRLYPVILDNWKKIGVGGTLGQMVTCRFVIARRSAGGELAASSDHFLPSSSIIRRD